MFYLVFTYPSGIYNYGWSKRSKKDRVAKNIHSMIFTKGAPIMNDIGLDKRSGEIYRAS